MNTEENRNLFVFIRQYRQRRAKNILDINGLKTIAFISPIFSRRGHFVLFTNAIKIRLPGEWGIYGELTDS